MMSIAKATLYIQIRVITKKEKLIPFLNLISPALRRNGVLLHTTVTVG